MRIIQVTLGKTINIGNYESVRIDLVACVEHGEDHRTVLTALKIELKSLEAAAQTMKSGSK